MASTGEDLVEDGLLTMAEAQAFSRLSRSDLYIRMKRGELAFCKLGSRRLIPRRALVEMAARSLVSRPSAPGRHDACAEGGRQGGSPRREVTRARAG